MAKVLTTTCKAHLDRLLGSGGAVKVVNLITSSTALDNQTRSVVEKLLGSVGEGAAFITNCTGHTALSTAAMNRLEHHLHGRGNAEELNTAIQDGTVT